MRVRVSGDVYLSFPVDNIMLQIVHLCSSCLSMSLCDVKQSEEEHITQSFVIIIRLYFACGALSVQTLLF